MEREESRHSFRPRMSCRCNQGRMEADDATIKSQPVLPQYCPRLGIATRWEWRTHLIFNRSHDLFIIILENSTQLVSSIFLQRKQRLYHRSNVLPRPSQSLQATSSTPPHHTSQAWAYKYDLRKSAARRQKRDVVRYSPA